MNHSSCLFPVCRVHNIGWVDDAFGLYLLQTIIFRTYHPVKQLTSTVKAYGKLTFQSLPNNNFYGTIPLLSSSVEVLFLGTIPKQLTAMTDLIYLDLSKQKVKSIDGLGLRGSIPSFRYHASLKNLICHKIFCHQ